ncbi:MAG: PspC domain-containing protein [Sphingomicrobium sp.]
MNNRFVLNRSSAKIMGVGAGLADWLGIDVLIVRLALVLTVLFAGPVAILLYILTG